MDVTNECCCYCMFLEHSNTGVKKTQADERHPLASLQEPVYKPHSSQHPKPIEGKSISQGKEKDVTMNSSLKNRKRTEKSKNISVSTSEPGIQLFCPW